MASIDVQVPTQKTEHIPVNTRDVYLKMMGESARKGQVLTQPLEDILQHRRDADAYERAANEPTTDEMRLEKFGTPLPGGHPIAPKDRRNEL